MKERKTIPLWKKFSLLTNMVRQDHIKMKAIGKGGHDFLHALMVAQYGMIITERKHIGTLAWIAGICHNTDHLFPKETEGQIEARLRSHLDSGTNLSEKNKNLIIEAVMNHSKLNDPKDNPVTIALKDADRLANIGPNIFIRSAQFYHNLPPFDPQYLEQVDPASSFNNPKTVLRDIRSALEWEGKDPNGQDWIRLPKAKKIAGPWFELLWAFLEGFAKQLKEVGLYPFPKDFVIVDKE